MRGKPLKFATTESGCIVPTSHKLNKDGYFRYTFRSPTGGRGIKKMYHRHVWETHNGREIPEGYEIDHICNNRACQNIAHLQILDRTTHLVKTNRSRYADRKEKAKAYWLETKCSGAELADKFGVSFSSGCSWIRGWKV